VAQFWVADAAESLPAVIAGQDRAVTASDKAIALRPDLPDGYFARGFVRVPIRWDWQGASADLRKALELKPDDPDALLAYATTVLRGLNRLPEANAALRKAAELDPLNARIWSALGTTLSLSGQRPAAFDAYNRSLEISPEQSFTPYNLAATFILDGQPEAALAAAQRSANPVFRLAGTALAQHDLGHTKEAQAALDELIAKWGYDAAYQIGQVYGWWGEKDRALEWLERAVQQRDGGLVNIKVDTLLARLHGDPRFQAVLKKMNLPVD
jgi:serine/threonine-protein kinase